MSGTRLEREIGRVLRTGVTVSSVCLSIGLALSLLGLTGRTDRLLLDAGLIVLLGTPVARVAISVIEYVLERDWMFVVLTSIVLAELLTSVVAAILFR
jgi:uncharacterized membrane protein